VKTDLTLSPTAPRQASREPATRSLASRAIAMACVLLMGLWASPASAETRTLCAYDPAGKAGDFFRLLNDYALEAGSWGVDIQLKAYTDEETAAKDYEAGVCDGVVATGVRLQRFNNFPSTMEAIGALPNYAVTKQLVNTLAKYPSAAAKLRKGEHETVGIITAGAVYLFVRDRNINTVAAVAGKRVATMDYDKAAPFMVNRLGAIVVPADLGSIGPKFNNGDVDVCYMSGPGYGPFELHRGLAKGGGVIRAPLAQATFQVLIRHSKFPADFPAKSRTYWAANFSKGLAAVKKAEAAIPAAKWIDIPPDRLAEWEELFLNTRVDLKKKGAYDASMLSVMKKLRCASDKTRSECAENRE
jgi:hypothetical protein